MPSRDTWGEFPAFCGGEEWEEVLAEEDRERRNPAANPPSAPGGALVRTSQGIRNGFGKGLHSPLLPLALPNAGQRPAQVILRDLQEAHGMPSRDTWGDFLLTVEGKSGRKSWLRRTGRGGTRQPTHLLHQEVLLYVGGHRIPDGNSLWRAKEKRVTLCTCRFPAALPLPGGSEVADGKCRLRAKIGCSSAPVVAVERVSPAQRQDGLQQRSCGGCGAVYLRCRCRWVWRHASLRGHPRRSSSCSASCQRVAPCWRQPCRSSSLQVRLLSTRCSFRMQDPPACTAFIPLPGGRVTNVATATR